MKAFLLSLVAAVAISITAAIVLETYQGTADRAYVGKGASPDPEPKLSGKPAG